MIRSNGNWLISGYSLNRARMIWLITVEFTLIVDWNQSCAPQLSIQYKFLVLIRQSSEDVLPEKLPEWAALWHTELQLAKATSRPRDNLVYTMQCGDCLSIIDLRASQTNRNRRDIVLTLCGLWCELIVFLLRSLWDTYLHADFSRSRIIWSQYYSSD